MKETILGTAQMVISDIRKMQQKEAILAICGPVDPHPGDNGTTNLALANTNQGSLSTDHI
jgi:hypothetical protein